MFRNFLRRRASGDFARNVAKLAGGTTLAQLLLILASPILTRLYTPAAFGELAVYSSMVAIGVVAASARFELGVVIAGTRPAALRLVSLAGVILLGWVLLLFLFLLLWPHLLIQVSGFSGGASLLFLLPVSLLALGSHQILVYWSNRMKAYGANALSKVMQSLAQVASAVGLGLNAGSGTSLILSHVAGAVAGAGVLVLKNRGFFPAIGKNISPTSLLHTGYRYRDFPLYSLPTAILDTVSLALPVFLISNLFSGSLTGQYSLAFRILSLPVNLIGISLGQVFFQKLSETHRRKGDVRRLIVSTWSGLILLGVGPMLLLLLLGPALFRLVFGPDWEEAGRIASILAFPLFLSFCSSPTSSALIVFRVQQYSLVIGVLTILLRPLAFYLGYLQTDLHLSLLLLAAVDVLLLVGFNLIIYRKAS